MFTGNKFSNQVIVVVWNYGLRKQLD